MLRSTYDDGSIMSRKDIGDELLTLLAAGHETTAATLGWAFERLSRHPDVLAALVEEVDNGGHELRQAAILEVQRARTVIDFAARRVNPPVYQLGEWVIPRGYSIIINIAQIHGDPDVFPQPDRFDPQRYIGSKPSPFAWILLVAGPAAVSGPHSPTWRWMWCCERCCATSPSRPPRPRASAATVEELHSPRRMAVGW